MLHPRERARKQALERAETLASERREKLARREPFERYAELEAAELATVTAGDDVANVVACERCGVDVDLDDPATVTFLVTGAVKRLDPYNVDFSHFTIPRPDAFPTTPYGQVVALRPPEQDEIARCAACAAHLLAYMGRGPGPAPEEQPAEADTRPGKKGKP
jgi:hypothetical protein